MGRKTERPARFSGVSRRRALGALGSGAGTSIAGCLDETPNEAPAAQRTTAASPGDDTAVTTDAKAVGPGQQVVHEQPSDIRYVESAAGMNQALRGLGSVGGTVRWIPGEYTGESFTEMVEIPPGESSSRRITLDMRSVSIHVRTHDPYRGEDGAFFQKPKSDGSESLYVIGPDPIRISGPIDVDPTPHVFYLFNTRRCRIAPSVIAKHADRILYFRQHGDCGHHVFTNGFRSWGGNVGIQIGDERDNCGKDRCHWYGQIAGYKEAGTHLEYGINNRVWAQFEGPQDDHRPAVAGHRIRNGQNSLMLTHIHTQSGHGLDIQARNTGIFDSGLVGNPQPFQHSRMGIRPTNVHIPNYETASYDFTADHRPMLRVTERGSATVEYDGTEGELVLTGGSDGDARAAVQTPGPFGRMGHHAHGYANARVVGADGENADAVFRFGAWVDGDNYAVVTYDPRDAEDGVLPLRARVVSRGETLSDVTETRSQPGRSQNAPHLFPENPSSWIVYVRADYQAFFHNYELVHEATHDLTDWPANPKLRVDAHTPGDAEHAARVRRLEHGFAMKSEEAEQYVTNRGDPTV